MISATKMTSFFLMLPTKRWLVGLQAKQPQGHAVPCNLNISWAYTGTRRMVVKWRSHIGEKSLFRWVVAGWSVCGKYYKHNILKQGDQYLFAVTSQITITSQISEDDRKGDISHVLAGLLLYTCSRSAVASVLYTLTQCLLLVLCGQDKKAK